MLHSRPPALAASSPLELATVSARVSVPATTAAFATAAIAPSPLDTANAPSVATTTFAAAGPTQLTAGSTVAADRSAVAAAALPSWANRSVYT